MKPATSPAVKDGRASTVTPIDAPLWLAPGEDPCWDDGADLLVIGWGAAGACAALEARAAGASVWVVDRFGGGGASALSGGVVYAGGGTRQQREAGFDDSPAAMADYLRHEVNGVVGEATLQRFCADSAANLAWLEAHGVPFGSRMPPYKTSYPPADCQLYYSGNEVVPAYRSPLGAPAPRGHRAASSGQSGAVLFEALQAATRRSGAQVMTQAAVRRLICQRTADGAGVRVLGVEVWRLPPDSPAAARHAELDRQYRRWRTTRPRKAMACLREAARLEQAEARPLRLRAERAVLLSTGGFIFNPELLRQHAPAFRRGWPVGGAGCDGSGLRLGQSVGAAAQALGNVSAWRFITPPADWPRGVVIDLRGERFCNEQVYGATLGAAMVEQKGGRAWLILDGALRRRALWQCLRGGLWAFQALPAIAMMLVGARKGRNAEALAARIGADPATLRATLDAARAAARGEVEDPQGKSADMRHALAEGPLYALDISIGTPIFPLAVLTLGGLVVDEASGQVRDAAGQGIPGLYAAGRSAIGLASSRYVSGLSLADCVFSGRRAGRAAVQATQAAPADAAAVGLAAAA